MTLLSNGDIFLVDLRPEYDFMYPIQLIDYTCYYPWFEREFLSVLVYNHEIKDAGEFQIEELQDAEHLCQPIPINETSAMERSILPAGKIFAQIEPYTYLRRISGIEKEVQKIENPEIHEAELSLLIYCIELNKYVRSDEISKNILNQLEYRPFFTINEIKYRIILEILKKDKLDLRTIYRNAPPDKVQICKAIYYFSKDTTTINNEDFSALFITEKETLKRESPTNFWFYWTNFLHQKDVFDKYGIKPNLQAWTMIYKHLTDYQIPFEASGFLWSFKNPVDCDNFEKTINNLELDPSSLDNIINSIPDELIDANFPRKPRDPDELYAELLKHLDIEVTPINSRSKYFSIYKYSNGTHDLVLDIDTLFKVYFEAFDKNNSYPNGYNWERIIYTTFTEQNYKNHYTVDAEAGSLTITISNEKIFKTITGKLRSFLKDEAQIVQAIKEANQVLE